MPYVDFIGYAPDLPKDNAAAFSDTGALLATGAGFFRPQPSPVAFGSALPATCFGTIEAVYLGSTIRYFAGTASHIYEETGGAGGSWAAVDGGTSFTVSTTQPGAGWRFITFGNVCIAMPNDTTTAHAPRSVGTSGNFATIPAGGTDEMPTARVIESISNNFVVLGNIITSPDGSYPASGDRWWTSAQGDYTTWDPSTSTLCSTGRLYDTPGDITAIKHISATSLDFAVFKQRSMYVGHFTGLPLIWAFIPQSKEVGAFSQESINRIGNMLVWPSFDDFWTFDGNSLQRFPNPLRTWFYTNVNLNALITGTSNIFATYDRIRTIAYWAFPTTSTTVDTWVAWNAKSNKWTKGTFTAEAVISPEVNLTTPSVGWFNSSHVLQTISGTANTAAYAKTNDFGDHIHMFHTTRIRPKFETFPTNGDSFTTNVYTRLNLGDTQTQVANTVPLSSAGWVDVRANARWTVAQFNFGADAELIGAEIVATPAGTR